MILKALTLENFKGIREPVRIEFAPLTLLFGPNNAGKSTIVQALMYAREILQLNNTDATRTQLGGDVVELGGFLSLVNDQDPDRAIRMRFELDLSPGGVPNVTDSEREQGLEFDRDYFRSFTEQDCDTATDIAIDTAVERFPRARAALTDVWVEFEIAKRQSPENPHRTKPMVHRYSVGTGTERYATISLLRGSDQAALTYFNFGIAPFGACYAKGDATDFEWDLERIARHWARDSISLEEYFEVVWDPDLPLERDDSEALIARIVNGEGEWGDDSPANTSGQPNGKFQARQQMLAQAEAAGRVRAYLKENPPKEIDDFVLGSYHSYDDLTHELGPDVELLEASGLSYAGNLNATEQVEGWLLDLCEKIHVSLPRTRLTITGTALPDWEKRLAPYTEISIHGERVTRELKKIGIEYLLDFLTAIIVGPGRLLLDALKRSIYLGPVRRLPSRQYRQDYTLEGSSWANGLAAWDQLLRQESQPLVDAVNDWLDSAERFATGYRITMQRYKTIDVGSALWRQLLTCSLAGGMDDLRDELLKLPEGGNKIEFVKTSGGGKRIALAPQDLGVGISQLLPVIVAALQESKGIVAIEEPESNIHPAFQVVLADLFITQAKANPGVLFLVETHSEHLMLRCLRRIRETASSILPEGLPEITPGDLAVHFVEPTNDGPRIHRIEIDEDGDFMDEWPGGFFEESFHEKFAGR